MTNLITHIQDSDFDTIVLDAKSPVLVDFWAPWCGPCKALNPILEALAKTYEGKIKFVKLNIDDNTETASKYGIRSIPTLLLFKNGKKIDMKLGVSDEGSLKKWLDELSEA